MKAEKERIISEIELKPSLLEKGSANPKIDLKSVSVESIELVAEHVASMKAEKERIISEIELKPSLLEKGSANPKIDLKSVSVESIELVAEHVASMKAEKERIISEIELKIKQKEDEINSLKGKNLEKKEIIDKLNKAENKNKCPVCESPLTAEHKIMLLRQYNDEIKNNNDKINFLLHECAELKEGLDKLKVHLKQIDLINFEVIRDKKEEYKKISDNIDDLLNKLKNEKLREEISNKIKEEIKKRERELEENKLKEAYFTYLSNIKFLESSDEENKKNKIIEYRKNIDSEEKEIQEIASKISVSVSDAESEMMHLEKLRDKYNNLCGKAEKKDQINSDFISLKKEILNLTSELNVLNEKLKNIQYDETRHQELKKNYEVLDKEVNKLKVDESGLKAKKEEISKQIKEIEDEINDLNNKIKEQNKLKNFIKLLNEIRDLFSKDKLQKEIRSRSIPVIRNYAKEFFSEFDFEYSDLNLDEDYNITLYGPNGENTIDMISGGEKIAAALSLRLGITKALSSRGVELLILDEPTIYLDTQRRKELVEVFKKLKIPQIIIVSHDKELEETADKIYFVSKEKGITKIVY